MNIPHFKFTKSGFFSLNRGSKAAGESFVRRHPGLVLYLLITLLVASLYLNGASMFENLEAKIQDLLFKVRAETEPSGQVVLLAVDDRSLDYIGQWPWGHQRMAQLIEALTYYEPKAMVIQLPIEENVQDYVSGASQLLAENILQAENVILPFLPVLSSRTPRTSTAPQWLQQSSLSSILPFEAEYVPPAARLELPDNLFGASGKHCGAFFSYFDRDNKIRRQPLLVRYEERFYPSIELVAAAFAMDIPLDRIRFDQEQGKLALGKLEIPVDRDGTYRINFYGQPPTFPVHSIRDFWGGQIPIEAFKGKTLIVALTALGLSDQLSTPLGDEFTPAEKSASIIDNILTGRFISHVKASSNTELLVIVVIGLFCAAILPRVSLMHRLVILLIFGFVIVNFNFILFTSFDTLASTFYPTLEVFLFAIAAPLLSQRSRERQSSGEARAAGPEPQPITAGRQESADSTAQLSTEETQLLRLSDTDSEMYRSISEAAEAASAPVPSAGPDRASEGRAAGPMPEGAPTSLGRYEVIEVVGEGAMGTVYKGKDPAIGRMVALKTIRVDRIADVSEVDELRERLIREANAAGNLSHPNIVTIYDVGEQDNLQYVAMEYLEGHTLERIISRRLNMNYRIAAKIVFQVCSALSYAHRHSIVHRDIKPANIMVLENFHVKVMDFGIAHFESSSLTQAGVAMGTPNYISPEQLKGEPVTPSSDIFSLGVVFYEMLSKRKPFVGDSISNLIFKITNETPPPPSRYDSKMPPMLDLIVRKALQKNPYDRYQSADEMGKALEDFVTSLAGSQAKF